MSQKLIFVVGLPLSGKTTLGNALSAQTNIPYVDIDTLAVAAALGPPPTEVYATPSSKERERKRMWGAYTVLSIAADMHLQLGQSLIISATFSRPTYWNDLFFRMLKGHPTIIPYVLWCKIEKHEQQEVLKRLNREGYLGGCRSVDHYFSDKERYAPPPLSLAGATKVIDSSRSQKTCLRDALSFLKL